MALDLGDFGIGVRVRVLPLLFLCHWDVANWCPTFIFRDRTPGVEVGLYLVSDVIWVALLWLAAGSQPWPWGYHGCAGSTYLLVNWTSTSQIIYALIPGFGWILFHQITAVDILISASNIIINAYKWVLIVFGKILFILLYSWLQKFNTVINQILKKNPTKYRYSLWFNLQQWAILHECQNSPSLWLTNMLF